MRKTVIRRLNLIQYKRSFQESWITTIRQDKVSFASQRNNVKVEKLKIKESIAFSQSRETIQDRNYRNETQAIDSEKQFIENEAKKSSSYKEHKVNALASGADEGRD